MDNNNNNNNTNNNNIINSYKSDDYYIEYFINNQNEKKENEKKEKKNNFQKIAYSSESSIDIDDNNIEHENYSDDEVENYKVNKEIPKFLQNFNNYNNHKKIFCTNCGKYGHNYKKCIYPITSVGIICISFAPVYFNDMIYYIKKFQDNSDINEEELIKLNKIYENIKTINEQNYEKIIKYLMVQRKYSFSYVEIIRGKYDLDNIDYINNMIQYMTMGERERILKLPFQKLWCELWYVTNNEINREKEMNVSNEKFNLLRNGITIRRNDINITYSLEKLIKNAKYKYDLPEWGFPKGRRNLKEKNIDCAHREFKEETSLKSEDYQIINLSPIEELFMGMNNIKYKNIYYISQACKKIELKVDEHNELQKIEISNIQWYTLNQCLDILREYDIEKRNSIINNHNLLKSIFFLFQNLLKNYLQK
jgi:8-oxo-dGTP pyrophosphatase MutT (NUDIX family)